MTVRFAILLAGALMIAGPAQAPAAGPAEPAFREGLALYEAADYAAAAAAFERAVEAAPEVSEYQGWLGRTYAHLAEARRSPFMALKTRRALERAVGLDGCNLDALEDLMEYYAAAPFLLGGSRKRAGKIRACLARDGCPCDFRR